MSNRIRTIALSSMFVVAVGASLTLGGAACPPEEQTATPEAAVLEYGAITYPPALAARREDAARWVLAQAAQAEYAPSPAARLLASASQEDRSARLRYLESLKRYTLSSRDGEAPLILSLELDRANSIRRVLLDDVVLEGDRVKVTADQLLLVYPDGRNLLEVTLSGPVIDLLGVTTTASTDPRVRIGITMEDVPAALAAQLRVAPNAVVMIASVEEGGPAARACMQPFDVITHVDGKVCVTQDSIQSAVQAKQPGESLTFDFIRQGTQCKAAIVVEAYAPPATSAAGILLGDYVTAAQAGQMERDLALDPNRRLYQVDGQVLVDPLLQDIAVTRSPVEVATLVEAINGVTLNIQPRILDERIVLDTMLVPSRVAVGEGLRLLQTESATTAGLREQFAAEIAQMEAQLARLKALLDAIDAAEAAESAGDELP